MPTRQDTYEDKDRNGMVRSLVSGDGRKWTGAAIARVFDLSRERIRQIVKKKKA